MEEKEMKKQIKWISVIIILALMISIAGCKPKVPPVDSSDDSKSESSSSEISSQETSSDIETSAESSDVSDSESGSVSEDSSQESSADPTSGPAATSTPAPTPKPTEPFNEEAFATIANGNLSIVHHVSQDEYRTLVAKGQTDAIWATATDFEKKYGGRVRITVVPFANLVSRTISMQSANNAPDLLATTDQSFPSTATSKVLQPLDDLKDASGKKLDFQKSLWSPLVLEAFKYGGKYYAFAGLNALPTFSLIFYNESMFKQERLTLPKELYKQGKWNWAEFQKAARALTKSSEADQYEQIGFATWTLIPSLFALANDTAIVRVDATGKYNANLNDAKMISTLNFLSDAFKAPDQGGFMSLQAGLSFESDFPAGKVAMIHANIVPDTIKFDWDVVPMPYGPDNKDKKLAAQIFGHGIPTGSKNPEGALAFVHMMNDPKYSAPNVESTKKALSGNTNGRPDPNKGTYNYDNFRNPAGPANQLKAVVSMDRNFSDVWTIYWNICQELEEGIPPATVAATYQTQVQSLLDRSYGG